MGGIPYFLAENKPGSSAAAFCGWGNGLFVRQTTDTTSENIVLPFGLAEVSVMPAPDATGGVTAWDRELPGGLTWTFPPEREN